MFKNSIRVRLISHECFGRDRFLQFLILKITLKRPVLKYLKLVKYFLYVITKVGSNGWTGCTSNSDCLPITNFQCSTSNTCSCKLPYVWDSTSQTCDCVRPYIIWGGSCVGLSLAKCVTGSINCYTTSHFQCTSSQCQCNFPYTWNSVTKTCDCVFPFHVSTSGTCLGLATAPCSVIACDTNVLWLTCSSGVCQCTVPAVINFVTLYCDCNSPYIQSGSSCGK